MMRQPKPWFWKARNAWYVQLHGKQVRLHESKKEADREFYRVMAAAGQPLGPQQMLVGDACEALLAQSQHLRAATLRCYQRYLGMLANQFGSRRLDSLQPGEVIVWLRGYRSGGPQPFGDSSRCLAYRYCKLLMGWARDTGLLPVNQFARTPNPWLCMPRNRPMSEAEYVAVMTRPRLSKEFKEVLEFIWRTGIRPGELAILESRHLDATLPIARFQPTEHKTGTRTGQQREVYFPVDLWERLQRYRLQRRAGPLLRRRGGTAWTSAAITIYFCHIKRKLGLQCVLYQARHRFLTRLTDAGIPAARVAKIAGHRRIDTLLTNYYHPDAQQMATDVDSPDESASAVAAANAVIVEQRDVQNRKVKAEYQRRYTAKRKLATKENER